MFCHFFMHCIHSQCGSYIVYCQWQAGRDLMPAPVVQVLKQLISIMMLKAITVLATFWRFFRWRSGIAL